MVLIVLAWSRRRRLHSTVVGPLDVLLVATERLAAGDRSRGLVCGGREEFVQLADGLERMAEPTIHEARNTKSASVSVARWQNPPTR